jgi:two-component system sensor histidine kinase AtoS
MKKTKSGPLLARIFGDRARREAEIVETRLAVSLLVLLLTQVFRVWTVPPSVPWIVAGYMGLTVLTVLIFRRQLDRKRIRLLPELLDILTISLLVHATGGLASTWFVLYLFPVLSSARFLGPGGIFALAAASAVAYAFAASLLAAGTSLPLSAFALRALALGGVSLTAANLARTRDSAEAKLIDAVERIDLRMLADGDLQSVMDLILETAMELTQSDLSAIVLIEDRSGGTGRYAVARPLPSGDPGSLAQEKAWATRQVGDRLRKLVEPGWREDLVDSGSIGDPLGGAPSVDPTRHRPERVVPLEIEGTNVGALGVFSRRRWHYFTSNDVRKLQSLAPLVAMAQKNSRLFRESRRRLDLLYQIGEQIQTDHGLTEVFRSVVRLVSDQLGSEEAALFVPNPKGEVLEKKAVAGPDSDTTERLDALERSYPSGVVSCSRRVFESREPLLVNEIPPDEIYVEEYSKALPSRVTRHYLGVPLLLGADVLGVIRVLNKKAWDYSPAEGRARLAKEGFRDEDVNLLSVIATQVAAAIRNATFVEQKSYFENLIYASPDPIIVVDHEGKVRNFNHACEEIWGRKEWEVRGSYVGQFYESEERVKEVGRLLRSAPDHILRNHPTMLRGGDGRPIPIRLSAASFFDETGQRKGSIGIFRDQREVLRLEEEKLRSEKLAALGRLAQTAGHDIKHDLGTIFSFLTPLERSARSEPATLRALQSIRAAATEARDKLQNMLSVGRPQAPQKQVTALKAAVEAFEASVRLRAAAARVQLVVHLPETDPQISADAEQLRQVFANLFGNSLDAIKLARAATPRRQASVIEVTLEVEAESARLTWRDDGYGMSQEALERAFTALYTTKETGSGLGLYITRTIVESHQGSISVESEEGVGTTFRIDFPLVEAGVVERSLPSEP